MRYIRHDGTAVALIVRSTRRYRALLRAMIRRRLCERLFELAKVGSVGITTGEAFCGVVGSKTRKEYTVLVSVAPPMYSVER